MLEIIVTPTSTSAVVVDERLDAVGISPNFAKSRSPTREPRSSRSGICDTVFEQIIEPVRILRVRTVCTCGPSAGQIRGDGVVHPRVGVPVAMLLMLPKKTKPNLEVDMFGIASSRGS